jgi:hypothetical protein
MSVEWLKLSCWVKADPDSLPNEVAIAESLGKAGFEAIDDLSVQKGPRND